MSSAVVPLAGTWIEIDIPRNLPQYDKSFPLRERGLKYEGEEGGLRAVPVVPLAGTWIEICTVTVIDRFSFVVPLAGTWIEIHLLPLCGSRSFVVPLAGTWIEIQ